VTPIFSACSQLTCLTLSSCKRLHARCLMRLAGVAGAAAAASAAEQRAAAGRIWGAAAAAAAGQRAAREQGLEEAAAVLPHLCELDLSYCPVPAWLVDALLLGCTQLVTLHLNGVEGVTGSLWRALQQHTGAGGAAAAAAAAAVQGGGGERAAASPPAPAAVAATAMDVDSDDDDAAAAAADDDDDDGDEGGELVEDLQGIKIQSRSASRSTIAAAAAAAGGAAGGAAGTPPDTPPRAALHALEALSLVRCARLHSLCLGVAPAPRLLEIVNAADAAAAPSSPHAHQRYHAAAAAAAAAVAAAWQLPLPPPAAAWLPAPSPLQQLRSLRLGLSAVEVVALELPLLEQLDLNGCTHLRCLHLATPRLDTLLLQACSLVGVQQVAAALGGCPALRVVDVQHTGWGSQAALQAAAAAQQRCAVGAADGGSSGGGICGALAALGSRYLQQQKRPAGLSERRHALRRVGSSRQVLGGGAGASGSSREAAAKGLAVEAGGKDGLSSTAPAPHAGGLVLESVLVCGAGCAVCSRKNATFLP